LKEESDDSWDVSKVKNEFPDNDITEEPEKIPVS
jgi:hypothetical protein